MRVTPARAAVQSRRQSVPPAGGLGGLGTGSSLALQLIAGLASL